MAKAGVHLALMACLAVACGEQGSLVGVDGGESDATEPHDVVFVPQTDDDAGDGWMEEWDGSLGAGDDGGESGGEGEGGEGG